MIARSRRFHGPTALRYVYSRGATVRGSVVALKYIRNQRRSTYRAAVVVSRKVHHSAVVRNRIRRRLYEIIRLHEQEITEPYDLVLTVFSDTLAQAPADQLQQTIIDMLRRAGVLSSEHGHTAAHAIVNKKE